jgi:hypothetical protein
MKSKATFHALEVMSRERAAIAKKKWSIGSLKPRNGKHS